MRSPAKRKSSKRNHRGMAIDMELNSLKRASRFTRLFSATGSRLATRRQAKTCSSSQEGDGAMFGKAFFARSVAVFYAAVHFQLSEIGH